MTDYQNPDFDPFTAEEPFRRDGKMNPDARPANVFITGWIAAAVLVVALLAIGFGLVHQSGSIGTNTASNDMAPTAPTHMAPPLALSPPAQSTTAPISPAPDSATPAAPEQPNNQ